VDDLWVGLVDGFVSARMFVILLELIFVAEIANDDDILRRAPSEDEGDVALPFVSEDPDGVLICKADDEGTTPALIERGKPPEANRARVGEGGEVEALRGERDRGAVTLLGR
jgi:hypothetical protein